ncbi:MULTISPECIES: metal-dependent hydrolase [unclassified Exiguobacterium]|uniref:metal-dependent hydrolase n=1 Tax=unclassified Exiguobacterium TaxID=2644629 RepID=UPI000EE47AE5|nr:MULTISPECIES: metal-dependent hydrolase [unclassified Exiguobacterium]HAL00685.1 metal-dependent hydrolase [Exiguobacterium sp.]
MDTGTHIGMGLCLAAISTLHPDVAASTTMFAAVTTTALVGSHAPDFDTVFKFKGNSAYLRQHRGKSHGLIALLAWPLLLSIVIGTLFGIPPTSLWLMAQIAVALHVFVDLFNAYGTQALHPFKKSWIGWGVINTFDPYLFTMYYAAFGIWLLTKATIVIFPILIAIVIIYYAVQFKLRNDALATAARYYRGAHKLFISPGMKWDEWHVAARLRDEYSVVKINSGTVVECGNFRIKDEPHGDALYEIVKQNADLQAFLEFSKIHTYTVSRKDGIVEYRFTNLRYFTKEVYPFVAVVRIDAATQEIVSSYTGWVFSERTLQKKLFIPAL